MSAKKTISLLLVFAMMLLAVPFAAAESADAVEPPVQETTAEKTEPTGQPQAAAEQAEPPAAPEQEQAKPTEQPGAANQAEPTPEPEKQTLTEHTVEIGSIEAQPEIPLNGGETVMCGLGTTFQKGESKSGEGWVWNGDKCILSLNKDIEIGTQCTEGSTFYGLYFNTDATILMNGHYIYIAPQGKPKYVVGIYCKGSLTIEDGQITLVAPNEYNDMLSIGGSLMLGDVYLINDTANGGHGVFFWDSQPRINLEYGFSYISAAFTAAFAKSESSFNRSDYAEKIEINGSGILKLWSAGKNYSGEDFSALKFNNVQIGENAVVFIADDSTDWIGDLAQDATLTVITTLQELCRIPAGKTLTIAKDAVLSIPRKVPLYNDGTIINNGTIIDRSSDIIGTGTVTGKPVYRQYNTSRINSYDTGYYAAEENGKYYFYVTNFDSVYSNDGKYYITGYVTPQDDSAVRCSVDGDTEDRWTGIDNEVWFEWGLTQADIESGVDKTLRLAWKKEDGTVVSTEELPCRIEKKAIANTVNDGRIEPYQGKDGSTGQQGLTVSYDSEEKLWRLDVDSIDFMQVNTRSDGTKVYSAFVSLKRPDGVNDIVSMIADGINWDTKYDESPMIGFSIGEERLTNGSGIAEDYQDIYWKDANGKVIYTERLNYVISTGKNQHESPFEPLPKSWIHISRPDTQNITVKYPDSSDTLKPNDIIEINVKMGREQWYQAMLNSVGTYERVSGSAQVKFQDVLKSTCVGTGLGTDDSEASDLIDIIPFFRSAQTPTTFYEGQKVELAGMNVDGTSVTVVPTKENCHSLLFKTEDASGKVHRYRLNYKVIHEDTQSYKFENVIPAKGRFLMNTLGASGVTGIFEDGILRYTTEELGGELYEVGTRIKAPAGAVSAEIYAWGDRQDNKNDAYKIVDEYGVRYAQIWSHIADYAWTAPYKIIWKDAQGKTINTEIFTVSTRKGNSQFMDSKWAPVPSGRQEYAEKGLDGHLTYDESRGLYTFKLDVSKKPANELLERLCIEDSAVTFITAPEGAVKYIVTGWHTGLDRDSSEYESQMEALYNKKEFKYLDSTGKAEVHFGGTSLLKKTTIGDTGCTIYVAEKTFVGYTNVGFIEWYDANNNRIPINGKRGEYIQLKTEPGVQEKESTVQEYDNGAVDADGTIHLDKLPRIDEKITEAMAFMLQGKNAGKLFKVEIPCQTSTGNNVIYEYTKLSLVDADGTPVTPDGWVVVYMPYPEGVSLFNEWRYKFTVKHYTDDEHTKSEDIKVYTTLHGLVFATKSFSPFLTEAKEDTSGWTMAKTLDECNNFKDYNDNTQVIKKEIEDMCSALVGLK